MKPEVGGRRAVVEGSPFAGKTVVFTGALTQTQSGGGEAGQVARRPALFVGQQEDGLRGGGGGPGLEAREGASNSGCAILTEEEFDRMVEESQAR